MTTETVHPQPTTPSRPRVLLVGPGLVGGGAQHRFRRLSQHVFGGTASVAVFKTSAGDGASEFENFLDLAWTGPRSLPGMAWRLRQHVRQHAFDVVLGFGLYPNMISWAAVAGLRDRPALILTEVNAAKQESLEMHGSVRQVVTDAARRFVYPRADATAANSIDGLNDLIGHCGVPAQRTRRLPNLIDVHEVAALAASAPVPTDATPSICIASTLYRRKRVDTLLEAAANLDRTQPWRIDIIGDGVDRSLLEAQAQRLGIAERVRFHGWLANPYPIVARATASVLCSEFEGFSNAILEAMALQTPVVTSLNTSDAAEMCAQGAALGFTIGDAAGLARHLTTLLNEPAAGNALRTNATAYMQRHVMPHALLDYEALLRDARRTTQRN